MNLSQPLETRHLEHAADLLARAFFDNPPHMYIFPNAQRRPAQMSWLMPRNLTLQRRLGEGFCLEQDGRLAGIGFWKTPGAPHMTLLDMIRAGLPIAPFAVGPGAVRRVLRVQSHVDHQRDRALGDRQTWYLHNYAIDPALQGRGLGTRLLQDQLATLDARDPGCAVALETHKQSSVGFYERLGFAVVDAGHLDTPKGPLKSWVMVREPR